MVSGVKKDLILIGRITGVHGLAGNLRVASYADADTIFAPGAVLEAKHPDGSTGRLQINTVKPHQTKSNKAGLRVTFKSITDRTEAEALIGSELWIDRDALPEPEEADTYYWVDLIGLTVKDADTGHTIGTLETIMETGSNDVYVVKAETGEEHLIPALVAVVFDVDLDLGVMTVRLPEGLA